MRIIKLSEDDIRRAIFYYLEGYNYKFSTKLIQESQLNIEFTKDNRITAKVKVKE